MPVIQSSPLLALLDQRWEDEIKHIPDPTFERPYRKPVLDVNELARTCRGYADANAADPHAYARCRHYLRQGYWRMDEVQKETRGIIASRQAQGVTFAAVREAA